MHILSLVFEDIKNEELQCNGDPKMWCMFDHSRYGMEEDVEIWSKMDRTNLMRLIWFNVW